MSNLVMNYHDKLEGIKGAFSGRNLFEVLLTLVMDVVQDTELTELETKDLLIAIAEEIKP